MSGTMSRSVVHPLACTKGRDNKESGGVLSDQQWRSKGERMGKCVGSMSASEAYPINAQIEGALSVLVQ